MKNVKKFTCVMLCFTLLLSSVVTSYAAQKEEEPTTVTVKELDEETINCNKIKEKNNQDLTKEQIKEELEDLGATEIKINESTGYKSNNSLEFESVEELKDFINSLETEKNNLANNMDCLDQKNCIVIWIMNSKLYIIQVYLVGWDMLQVGRQSWVHQTLKKLRLVLIMNGILLLDVI